METVNKNGLGQVLNYDEAGSNAAVSVANKRILPALKVLADSYNSLGLQNTFCKTVFTNLMKNGIGEVREEFEEMIRFDMAAYRNPIARKEALASVDTYLQDLSESLEGFKAALKQSNELGHISYQFSERDFIFEDGEPVVNAQGIDEYFIKRIDSRAKLDVYEQLVKLRECYNETIAVIKSVGASMPRSGLVGSWLIQQPSGPVSFTDEVIINKAQVANIK